MNPLEATAERRARWLLAIKAARAVAADVRDTARRREQALAYPPSPPDHVARLLGELAGSVEALAAAVEELARALR